MKPNDYFVSKGISVVRFAVKNTVGISTMYRYLRGESSPSRERAKALEKATNGEVTAAEWRNCDG